MTNDAHSRRSPELQHAAANIRMVRVLYAQRLRDARHAARAGNPAAAVTLARLRATACAVPNPERRSDCARYAARAEALHRDLSTLDLDDVTARARLTAAARQADLFAMLQWSAPF